MNRPTVGGETQMAAGRGLACGDSGFATTVLLMGLLKRERNWPSFEGKREEEVGMLMG